MDPYLPPGMHASGQSSQASGIQIFNLGKTSIILLATFAGLALGVSIFTAVAVFHERAAFRQDILEQMRRNEIEVRLLEQQVMDQNALMLRAGLRQPEDFSNGPAGNLQYVPTPKK